MSLNVGRAQLSGAMKDDPRWAEASMKLLGEPEALCPLGGAEGAFVPLRFERMLPRGEGRLSTHRQTQTGTDQSAINLPARFEQITPRIFGVRPSRAGLVSAGLLALARWLGARR